MKSELTLQDILKYHNAEIYYQSEKYKIYSVNIITEHIELIHSQYWDMDVLDENSFTDVICISDCKLNLRDISELTDEEKDYISKYFIPKKFIDYTIEEILRECASYTVIALIDYFRSINIDIDGFLNSGKAVKK